MNYKIQIDNDIFDLNTADANQLDIVPIGNGQFHVLQNNKAYQVKLLQANYLTKTLTLEVNGNKYQLQIEDEYDQLVQKMGLGLANTKKLKNIKAPMPGLILDIMVEAGQTISKGDPLLILEAMKMENVLKAEGEGVIQSIEVQKGAAVDKGQVIIEMQ